MKADLHVHSSYSDGSSSVGVVLEQASIHGVEQISFVDHDTVDGLPEALRLGEKYGVEVIPGIELSAYDFVRNRKVHVLGYYYDPTAPHIKSVCQPILERRQAHSLWQIEQIKAAGFDLDIAAIKQTMGPGKTIYKQHIMRHLTTAAYSSTKYKQLYKSLFKGRGVAAGDIVYMDVFDAVQAIVSDGGLAVVAHPGQLNSFEIIPELAKKGLGGIERNHPDHDPVDQQKVEEIAERYNLIMTGGTDYHGSFGEIIEVGDISSPTPLPARQLNDGVYR
ncbi:PHP domain-containing protein [Virgibacillus sediminis]|uniref:PHP domain-containing protein n=1 Tax=Virgibacillus sediminis TaxID=202260 RepID=A0ABV7A154_9BACI